MLRTRPHLGRPALAALGLSATALVAFLAVAGWMRHGLQIFVQLAQDGWSGCF
ncbi:hypothetical protein [Mangrovibrevibacter kandeliae]|uniref:hypothetical protein n=1 Tax=Mangrovibrevibacter kandeliae TaxID=2968473 RepID=UPI0021194A6F|nr:hypothetical protein [Aurantimonas sp. CSK15Z-1]MCQ8781489.1 hypothetical protein [Aurantimonas sp. CSK15Z-1]